MSALAHAGCGSVVAVATTGTVLTFPVWSAWVPLLGYQCDRPCAAFAQHFQDFPPSADHLSNLQTAVQWALLQPNDNGGPHVLFPAWPCTLHVVTVCHLQAQGASFRDPCQVSTREDPWSCLANG